MIITLATADAYYKAFAPTAIPYSSRAFVELNAHKAQAVRHFVGLAPSGAPAMGITLGYDGDGWRCPFSAPFGSIDCAKAPSIEAIHDFMAELTDGVLQGERLGITLPPAFYAPELVTRCQAVMANMARKVTADYNYHYPLSQADDLTAHFSDAARKNYRRAMSSGFTFHPDVPVERAYAVIKANREARGYPLALSLAEVAATTAIIPASCHALSLDGADVAAAIVYHISPSISQVIYWGDAPGYSEMRPMNAFTALLFEHYKSLGISALDIGPSSKHGVPSAGLCRFKEAIGCKLSLKLSFRF